MIPYISSRAHLADAQDLLARFGPDAADEADRRADAARSLGNVQRFCAWRQVAHLANHLAAADPDATRH